MKFREIEFKYRAEGVSLKRFQDYCEARTGLKSFLNPSGYDYFYSHSKESDAFCRHRIGPDFNQLTFKRKTSETNNFIRTEHNLNLKNATVKQIAAFCSEFGYQYAGTIYKSCFIYKYDRHTLVYYVCYDINMNEVGRFIEIEMSETFPWESDDAAYSELKVIEASLHDLGIGPRVRVKRSLYEMLVA